MFRAILELLFTILIVIIARAVLTSLLRGVSGTSMNRFRNRPTDAGSGGQATHSQSSRVGGELHKDPVCGTYVPESTAFRRQIGGQAFYYCSDACREKHALVAR